MDATEALGLHRGRHIRHLVQLHLADDLSSLSLSLFLLPAGDGQLFQRVSYTTRNKKISNKISKKRRRRASGNLSLFSSKIYRSSGRRRKKKKPIEDIT